MEFVDAMHMYSKSDRRIIENCRRKLPELVAFFVCILVLSIGISMKNGYHMDELLSFELANAQFNPWIVPTQPQGRLAKFVEQEIEGETAGETFRNLKDTVVDVIENRGASKLLSYQADVYEEPVWITAETFRNYITVGKKDAFNYLSVYFNVKDDNHPPVHFMLLHTMSSLFRGSAEPFVGCVINLAAIAGILILLMKLGRTLATAFGMEEQARTVGIVAALSYGLSAGAMASVLLIRMYALLTFFCVAFFYLHVKKWKEEGFDKHNKWLITVTVLGFLTQYFFLFYCLILAAVTAVLLFVRKRKKELFCYIRSMIIAAIIGVGVFPFAIADVFSSGRGVEALENLAEGFGGFGSRIAAFARILAERTFGIRLTIVLAVAFVLSMVVMAVQHCRKKETEKETRKETEKETASGNKFALLWMLILPMVGYFLLAARMSPYLVDRYIMPLFPFTVLAGILFVLYDGGKDSKKINRVVCTLLLICQIIGLTQYDGSYMYSEYGTQRAMAEEYADLPCICVYEGVGYYENLLEFTSYEKTLLVTPEELKNRQDKASIDELEQVVVLLKEEVWTNKEYDVLADLEKEYGLTIEKILFRGPGAYGDQALLLTKSKK